jgi:hypothetical protein
MTNATPRKSRAAKRPAEDAPPTPSKRRTIGKPKHDQVKPDEGAPVNTTMPVAYNYEKKPENTLKIVSWNVCSLNASIKRGMTAYLEAEQPDIVCLQETKLQKAPDSLTAIGLDKLYYPHTYFSCSTVQKGYGKRVSMWEGMINRVDRRLTPA